MLKPKVVVAAAVLAAVVGAGLYLYARAPEPQSDARPQTFKVARRDFVKSLRLSGTVEAVEATTISTPRLAGQNNNSLIITTLVRAGSLCIPAICWSSSTARSRCATRSTSRPS